ncbi:MAG: division/cell wall cluster transcriptional repressor MraZ [Clostridia bacterium]|nr:division/cell wall cluster transcriptional repressor MraZ [Clostridia bacterium]
MFRGKVQNSIDAKNRVIIPVKYREELMGHCAVTAGLDGCLEVYPMSAWMAEEAKFATLPKADAEARALLRYKISNVEFCDLDKQGRIVIPQLLASEAGLEKELMTVGMLDHFEIWSKSVYDSSATGGLMKPEDFAGISSKFPQI